MVKEYLIYALSIAILSAFVLGHYFFSKKDYNFKAVALSKITEPALNSSLYESRFLILKKLYSNPIYPDMPKIEFSEIK